MKRLTAELRCCSFQPSQFPEDRLPQVAFAGRSNVGKSSLINLLVGQNQLARSSNTPGKTKGIHYYLVHRKLYFVDLPGYGYSKTSRAMRYQWDHLIGSYLEALPQRSAVLEVLDCRLPPSTLDLAMRDWLQARKSRFAVVLNKADKLGKSALSKAISDIAKEMGGVPIVPCSSHTGMGRAELWRCLFDLLGIEGFSLWSKAEL